MAEGDNAQGATANQGGSGGGQAAASQDGGTGSVLNPQGGGQQTGQAGAGGTGGVVLPGWLNEVSEAHRSNKMFHNIKGNTLREASEVILKNYDNAQRQLGRSIGIPNENDTTQKKAEFRKKVDQLRGVPAKVEDYRFEVPEVDGQALQTEMVTDFVNKAHQKGFTSDQIQFVLNEYARIQGGTIEGYRTSQKEALTKLQEEWGPRFARKAVLAQRIVKEVGGKDVLDLLDQTGLGNNVALVKFFADLGEWAAEDGFIPGEIAGVEGPDAAKKKIAEIQANKDHPYNNPKMAGTQAHKDAVAEMQRLHEIAYS